LLIAALTADGGGSADDGEEAVLVDGVSGTKREGPIAHGDYRQFYQQVRDAVLGLGSNPVPPAQVIPVIAVVEAAIRSSAEGRAIALPLTEAEIRAFAR